MLKFCESLHHILHLLFLQNSNDYIFLVISKEDSVPPGQVAEAKEDSVPPGQVAVADTIGARKRARMLKEIESL